jgi:hypothetical protein
MRLEANRAVSVVGGDKIKPAKRSEKVWPKNGPEKRPSGDLGHEVAR